MDSQAHKLTPISPTTRASAEKLAAEVLDVYTGLLVCLRAGGDLAAELLAVHGRLSELSEQAERAATEVFKGDQEG